MEGRQKLKKRTLIMAAKVYVKREVVNESLEQQVEALNTRKGKPGP